MHSLLSSISSPPSSSLHFISNSFISYIDADTVLILDAAHLRLQRVLPFSDVFPGHRNYIHHLATESAMSLLFAASTHRIAVWAVTSPSDPDVVSTRVHSSLILPVDSNISALHSTSGLLAVASEQSLAVYTLILENDLPTWSCKWSIEDIATPATVRFAPSLTHVVTTSLDDTTLRIYSTTTGAQNQTIPHPRSITNVTWRHSQLSSRDDLILYTVTSDSTLRIFFPVIDNPTQLQLHASLDLMYPSPSYPLPSQQCTHNSETSSVFWLDRQTISSSLESYLTNAAEHLDDAESKVREEEYAQVRKTKEMVEHGMDLFLRVLADGSMLITAVANIDRRPPTLLNQFTLQHTLPNTLSSPLNTQSNRHFNVPNHLYIVPRSSASKTVRVANLMLILSSPLTSWALDLVTLLFPCHSTSTARTQDTKLDTGLELLAQIRADSNQEEDLDELSQAKHSDEIGVQLIRTPEGCGLAALWTYANHDSRVDVWTLEPEGTLARKVGWQGHMHHKADMVVVLDCGNSFASYDIASSTLALHCRCDSSDKFQHTLHIPDLASLFSLPAVSTSTHARVYNEFIIGVTKENQIALIQVTLGMPSAELCSCSIVLLSITELPVLHSSSEPGSKEGGAKNALILPVDPMAWGLSSASQRGTSPPSNAVNRAAADSELLKFTHDVLLSVDDVGELAFWIPTSGGVDAQGVINSSRTQSQMNGAGNIVWKCTGRVRTGRKTIRMARCSSSKKSVLVVPCEDGTGDEEMTIWDSHASSFSSGLEFSRIYSESTKINDLDWTATPDGQSIIAVGFTHHVDLLCQQRMTYFDEGPGWEVCWRVDITNLTPLEISDSIWLNGGSLLVASGRQMLLYGHQRNHFDKTSSERDQSTNTSALPGVQESLFEHVARTNGPLQDWHPQMLLQCLLWGKIELVKDIIGRLALAIKNHTEMVPLEAESFCEKSQEASRPGPKHNKGYSVLFQETKQMDDDDNPFARHHISQLIETLEANPLPYLTPNEHAHLLVLIQTTLEIDEQRRSFDANGLRYLISMRSFYILNRRASTSPGTPASHSKSGDGIPRQTGRRERLRYRDMIWAFHSDSQDILLGACTSACEGKMMWSDARALGISVWLNSVETLKMQIEGIARNEYMAGDNRDPTACALFYFALGKTKLVHGLWRQAAWHKEQSVMLKFLANDFSDPRWRTAALKNAYALLGKRRFEYAAAFFLLGNSLKDAVSVCIKQMSDFQLAVALARIVEQSNDGPVLQDILNTTVLPMAFKEGNRWLANWAFWLLHRRDLAVKVLLTPMQDIATALTVRVEQITEPPFDDTSIALLFSQLRSKTLQAVKGASEISGRAEFNFVLQIARVFCRMGCHVLALDLLRSWSFEQPSKVSPTPGKQSQGVASTATAIPTRPVFGMRSGHMRRRSSILIDMDISAFPPTRPTSPATQPPMAQAQPSIPEEPKEEDSETLTRKAGIGSLMQSAKKDVQVPEFDMGAFF